MTSESNVVEPGSLRLQLSGSARREIDLHAIMLLPDGGATPAYDGGRSPGVTAAVRRANSEGECPECWHSPGCEEERPSALADARRSEGRIAGVSVRCLSVEMQFRGHTGYELPERQLRDLDLLRDRFGAERAT